MICGLDKKLKYCLALCLALCLFLTGCGAASYQQPAREPSPTAPPEASPAPSPPEEWTLCLYISGSNLESRQGRASKTIKELAETVMPENVTVVIQTGGASKWRTEGIPTDGLGRWTIKDGRLQLVETLPASSMGEAEALGDFLRFCQENFPSDRTAVVLWGHGGSPTEGVCFDEQYDWDGLSLSELELAFSAGLEARRGEKYDIVGFDCCHMAALETGMVIAPFGEYMVASQNTEPAAGWDYISPLAAIGKGLPSSQVAAAICDSYLVKCQTNGKDASATLSAIDLGKIAAVSEALEAALDELNEKHGSLSELRELLTGYADEAPVFGDEGNLIDLKSLAQAFYREEKSEAWRQLADKIQAAAYHTVSGSAVNGEGLSLWFPRNHTEAELKRYIRLTPLKAYGAFLESMCLLSYD